MDRCNLPLLVLDETADAIVNNLNLYGDCITVGMWKSNDLPYIQTVFSMYAKGIEKTDYGYDLKVGEIPIKIKVIQGRYEYLQPRNLDLKTYEHFTYCVPNPFKEYWEHRNEVL